MAISICLQDEGELKCGNCREGIKAEALVPHEIKGRRTFEGMAYIPSCNDCILKIRKQNGNGINNYPNIFLETW